MGPAGNAARRSALLALSLTICLLAAAADAQVRVRGYYRRDGTYVAPYTRRGTPAQESAPARPSGRAWTSSTWTDQSAAPQTLAPPPEVAPKQAGVYVDESGRYVDERGILRDADGRIYRSGSARAEFQRLIPCPETGLPAGSCPGWIVDHIVPLKNGGADDASNMQWQTEAEAKEKDRWEGELVPASSRVPAQRRRIVPAWTSPPPPPEPKPTAVAETPVCRIGNPERMERSRVTFRSWSPCPATGERSGDCPGYTIGFISTVEDCGRDDPSNLQWKASSR